MSFIRLYVIIFFLILGFAWSSPLVLLTSDRHVTAWNFVNYRFRLTNTSSSPILNPEINYYAKPESLEATVDFSSGLNPVTTSVVQAGQYTVVKFSLHGLFFPGDSVEIQCRIYSTGYLMEWDSSNDWSYQHNAEVYEPNYFIAVYDASHNILWGSDPLGGNSNASDVVLWTDRGSNFTVERYNGDTAEVVPTGRFWLIKDMPLSPKERDLLAERGIVKHSVGRHQGKTLALFRSETSVQKRLLDSLIAGFYNTVAVDDSTPVEVDFYQDSLYEDSSRIDMEIYCWPDVSVNTCVEEVAACGGNDIGVARGLLIAKVRKDSLQCLSHNVNIDGLVVQHELAPASSPVDRDAVNISVLQSDTVWLRALQMDSATKEWLSGVEYTGEGIVVGVYDTGIDFHHPDFNEYDTAGKMKPRTMDSSEYFGVRFDEIDSIKLVGYTDAHGSSVAGIIGGNGNNSNGHLIRGIAPKVHFYADSGNEAIHAQVGHVVNHSHITAAKDGKKDAVYLNREYAVDEAIFKNWKSMCTNITTGLTNQNKINNCVEGDTLIKTMIIAAANNGDDLGEPKWKHGIQRGFYSIMAHSKNPVVVGNMTSEEKVRFHHSSMGPTWDGRIKPDIMAPGATSQIVATGEDSVEIYVDFIKLYRQGSDTPYLVLDSNAFPAKSAFLRNALATASIDTINAGAFAYKFSCGNTSQLGISALWDFDSVSVSPTDEIEVRFRKGKGWSDNTIFGAAFFGTHESGFYPPPVSLVDSLSVIYPNENFKDNVWQVKVPTVWEDSNKYSVKRFSLSSLSSTINAYFLRLDFSFIKSIVSPDTCKSDSCGYQSLTDGGTSQAAPFVSGIAALMYQKFRDTTGDSLHKHSMRNSTVKALMIHTAVDMEDSPEAHFSSNPDLYAAHHDGTPHYTPYGKGPDFATGWGYVDGKAALDMISDYNKNTKEFARFREIEIANGVEKRWTTVVAPGKKRLRATLAWDDSPGIRKTATDEARFKEPKLVNDLDMYLVSPSGEYYYPWRLDPLPTEFITKDGTHSNKLTGFERIYDSDVHNAYRICSSSNKIDYSCFDHLNNVEVVDVDFPEPGEWQIVVRGRRLEDYNNADSNAQVATLVSDSSLNANEICGLVHNYAPQTTYRCTYNFNKSSLNRITFDDRTFAAAGDTIKLFDADKTPLGTYVSNQLAGKTIKVKSDKLIVELDSDDKYEGWGFGIQKIQSVPYSTLMMPFLPIYKKGNKQ